MDKIIKVRVDSVAYADLASRARASNISASELIRQSIAAHTGIAMPEPENGGSRPNAGRKHKNSPTTALGVGEQE